MGGRGDMGSDDEDGGQGGRGGGGGPGGGGGGPRRLQNTTSNATVNATAPVDFNMETYSEDVKKMSKYLRLYGMFETFNGKNYTV